MLRSKHEQQPYDFPWWLTGGNFWCSSLKIGKKLHYYDQIAERRRLWNLKATCHLTIFMRGMRTRSKIQMNNCQHVQCVPSFAGKTSSVPLITPMHAQRIVEWEIASMQMLSPGDDSWYNLFYWFVHWVSQKNFKRLIWWKLKTTAFSRPVFIFSKSPYSSLNFVKKAVQNRLKVRRAMATES